MDYPKLVWDFLKSKNLPDKSCSAVMGNIYAESGFAFNLIEVGNGVGFGLCQWSYERRTQLEAYGTDITHQLNFLWSELTGADINITGANYQWINQSNYLNHADFMNANGSINDLTASFCFSWERPNAQYAHLDVRQQKANEYYTLYTGSQPTDPTPTTGNCKLIYPYWYGLYLKKISFTVNNFLLLSNTGNVVKIKNVLSNCVYLVNKSSIKMI